MLTYLVIWEYELQLDAAVEGINWNRTYVRSTALRILWNYKGYNCVIVLLVSTLFL